MIPEAAPTLRGYQRDCLRTLLERYRAGARRMLVCLPTGTGKTVIFAELPRFLRMKKRLLVLAHREELLAQARDKLLRANPGLVVDVEQGDQRHGPTSQVVVASVPTLAHGAGRRLQGLSREDFTVVVVDEAHHAVSPSFRRVLDHFGVFAPDSRRLVVGFTATPKRGDRQDLSSVFEEIAFSRGLAEMIDAGYLAALVGYRVDTDVDLSAVPMRHGDYVASHLARAVNVAERNDLLVRVREDLLRDRKTLCFCVDVAHSREVAASFARAGVPAASVDGTLSSEDRARRLAAFRAGTLRVLTNCMLLTEGYDDPTIDGLLLARPTKSTLLYTQMIGRGTRLAPGKTNVVVVDVADTSKDHRIATLPALFALPGDFNLAGRTPAEVRRAIAWTEHHRPWVRTDSVRSLDDLRYRCEVVDLLALETPPDVEDLSDHAWMSAGASSYRLPLKGGAAVTLAPTILGEWEITLDQDGAQNPLGHERTLGHALAVADAYVVECYPEQRALLGHDARWRHDPASPRQRDALERAKIQVPSEITKGQAARLLSLMWSPRRAAR